MKNKKFLRYVSIPNLGIEDTLTGEIFTTLQDFAKEMNRLDERSNKIAEQYEAKKWNT